MAPTKEKITKSNTVSIGRNYKILFVNNIDNQDMNKKSSRINRELQIGITQNNLGDLHLHHRPAHRQ